METVPERLKGVGAPGIMMLGYEVGSPRRGPRVSGGVFPVLGWRWMLVLGVLPVNLVLLLYRADSHRRIGVVWRGRVRPRRRVASKLTPAIDPGPRDQLAFLNFM